jgi:hypothetical protein
MGVCKFTTYLAVPLMAGSLIFSNTAKADPFWGAIGGSIEGAIVVGIIGGGVGADIGATVGGISGFADGAARSHYRHRRQYCQRGNRRRQNFSRDRYRY